jgi:hypothetical protein
MSAAAPDSPFRAYRSRGEMEAAREIFLRRLAEGASGAEAALDARLDPSAITYWRRRHPDFEQAYQDARQAGSLLRDVPPWAGDLLVLLATPNLSVVQIAERLGVKRSRLYQVREQSPLIRRAWSRLRPSLESGTCDENEERQMPCPGDGA